MANIFEKMFLKQQPQEINNSETIKKSFGVSIERYIQISSSPELMPSDRVQLDNVEKNLIEKQEELRKMLTQEEIIAYVESEINKYDIPANDGGESIKNELLNLFRQ
jgi:hypothetical protein